MHHPKLSAKAAILFADNIIVYFTESKSHVWLLSISQVGLEKHVRSVYWASWFNQSDIKTLNFEGYKDILTFSLVFKAILTTLLPNVSLLFDTSWLRFHEHQREKASGYIQDWYFHVFFCLLGAKFFQFYVFWYEDWRTDTSAWGIDFTDFTKRRAKSSLNIAKLREKLL